MTTNVNRITGKLTIKVEKGNKKEYWTDTCWKSSGKKKF